MKTLLLALLLVSCTPTKFNTCDQCQPKECIVRKTEISTAAEAKALFEVSKAVALAETLDTIARLANIGRRSHREWFQDKQFTDDLAGLLRARGFTVIVNEEFDEVQEYQLIVSW